MSGAGSGRACNAKVTLSHSAREGVRKLAVTNDFTEAENVAIAAASSTLDPADLTVTASACTTGDPVELTVSYPFTYDIPLFGSQTLNLSSTGVMRCEA